MPNLEFVGFNPQHLERLMPELKKLLSKYPRYNNEVITTIFPESVTARNLQGESKPFLRIYSNQENDFIELTKILEGLWMSLDVECVKLHSFGTTKPKK